MCHSDRIEYFGELKEHSEFSHIVDGLHFQESGRKITILPDIYGLTDFYIGYASYLCRQGADVYLANPWSGLGGTSTMSREDTYVRRAKLKDKSYCDKVEQFLCDQNIDAVVGFCLGGNFGLEMAKRGYDKTNISIYPLPWGMDNQDKIEPAFDYMGSLAHKVNIFMGEADHLAGPDNINKLCDIVSQNQNLTLDLYKGSNHGFFTDLNGEDGPLRNNALDAIDKVNQILFGNEA